MVAFARFLGQGLGGSRPVRARLGYGYLTFIVRPYPPVRHGDDESQSIERQQIYNLVKFRASKSFRTFFFQGLPTEPFRRSLTELRARGQYSHRALSCELGAKKGEESHAPNSTTARAGAQALPQDVEI